MTSPRKFSVVIVGSGIGGLSAALCLAQKGHTVRVLERNAQLSLLGGAILLPSNATRIFARLGLLEELKEIAQDAPEHALRRFNDSKLIQRRYSVTSSKYPYLIILRSDLQQLLFNHTTQAGVDVAFNQNVTGLDEAVPSITVNDGSILEADLIIAADGVRSYLRPKILSTFNSEPFLSTESIFQIEVPKSKMESDSDLSRLYHTPGTTLWMGPKRYVITATVDKRGLYVAAFFDHDPSVSKDGPWVRPGDLGLVRRQYESFNPAIRKLIDITDNCVRWTTAVVERLPSWISTSGKAVLLGDSAHAMLPDAGQGATQCIEDAAVLSAYIELAKSDVDIPRITSLYHQYRQPRAEKVQKLANRNSGMYQLEDGPRQQRRDTLLQALHEEAAPSEESVREVARRPDPDAPFGSKSFSDWLYDHDAVAEALKLADEQTAKIGKVSRL